MNVKNFFSTVPKFKGLAATVGGFVLRYKRLTVATVAAALLFGPLLLTGDGELFVLNAVGLGIAFAARPAVHGAPSGAEVQALTADTATLLQPMPNDWGRLFRGGPSFFAQGGR